ncbi:MAG: KAP family NTPase [Chitinophagaceae bacterium]|nr:KAP family NTPase [Chitinophagaceae bacterium]
MGALFEKLEKTVGGILAIWALVLGIGKFIAGGQTRSAELYLASKKDPMNSFQKRFKNIIEGIKPGRVAVFIDDLDRCKSSYVISLLESLQTLFNYQNVFFIIAADKKWINACYEVEYQSIKSYIGTTGKPIGNLFIEKMFQQSIALPGVHKEMKEKLWDSLLSVDKQEITETDESIVKEMQNAGSLQETEEIIARSKEGSFATEHAVRLQAIKKITKKQNLEETEHLLKPYANLLDLNPRSMKRLINNYSAIKASSIISHIDIPTHQTVLWAILTMRWPIVAEYILEHAALSKGSINIKNGNLPAEINHLFKDEELINLLNGGGHKDGPLVANTVIQCRQLFI